LGCAYGALTPATLQYDLSDGQIAWLGTQTGPAAINELGDICHEAYNGSSIFNDLTGEARRGFLTDKLSSKIGNPFWDPQYKMEDDSYMDELLSPKYYGSPRGNGGPCSRIMHTRNNPAIGGGRGCIRACYAHLEAQGKLTHKFVKPFKRHKEWKLD
jgi:hypothetical protein